jgi:hypothetical protein
MIEEKEKERVRWVQATFAVAVIALIVGLVAIAMPFISPPQAAPTPVTTTSIPVVDQRPATRVIVMEWEATLPSTQDRWFPQSIVINQGDTIFLTLIINDTDGAHTFTMLAPTGPGGALQLTQINMSMVGQWMYHPPAESGPMFGIEVGVHRLAVPLWGRT